MRQLIKHLVSELQIKLRPFFLIHSYNRQFKKNVPSNYKKCVLLLTIKRKKGDFCLKLIKRNQFEMFAIFYAKHLNDCHTI